MAYLAAASRQKGYFVRIIDAHLFDWGVAETVSAIIESRPDLVALSVLHTNLIITAAVMVALRRKGFSGHFVLGGYYPTFHAEDILRALPEPAFLIRGEADISFPALVDHLAAGGMSPDGVPGLSFLSPSGSYCETSTPEPINDLDTLPFPARDTLSEVFGLRNPVISISPSRGCPYTCSFCSIIAFYRRSRVNAVRERSVDNVLDEIEFVLDLPATRKANADFVWFCADEFVGEGNPGEAFADRFADAILKRGLLFRWEIACRVDRVSAERFRLLHAAGLRSVYLGVESFSEEVLRTFHKEATAQQNKEAIGVLKTLGISYSLGTIFFGDKTRFEDLEITHQEVSEIGYRHVTMPLARLKKFSSRRPSEIWPRWRNFQELLDDTEFLNLYRVAYRIYDYKIEDLRVARLSEILSGVRKRNEGIVSKAVELLDSGLLAPVSFWKLVFHLRDGLGSVIERAISGVRDSRLDGLRQSLLDEIRTAKDEVEKFAAALRAKETCHPMQLYGRHVVWEDRENPSVAGMELYIAEQEYQVEASMMRETYLI